MEYLGPYFKVLITPLLEWMREDTVGPALAGIITIAGVLVLVFLIYNFFRDQRLLNGAISIIGDRNESDFAYDYNLIDQDLSKIPKVGHAWSEFCETLIPPQIDRDNNLSRPCENTVRPQGFFNAEELGMGPDFLRILPSVFVGVGLSLTFLGLISALGQAVETINMSAGNTGSIQKSIAQLLQISSAKFYASLFALFMSVILTVSIRLASWRIAAKIDQFNRKLESVVRYLSNEKLAMSANTILENQLTQLQTFNTDLAMKIGEQVQTSLSQSLAPVIKKLDNMGGDMAQQNIDAIKDISEEVVRGIQGASSDSMDRVAETLDRISEKLGSLSETLGNALSNFDADFQQMLDGLKTSLKESTEGVAEGIGQSITNMSDGIGTTAKEVNNIINGLTSTVETLANTGAEISKQGGEELRKQVEAASNQASERIAEAGKELALGFQASTQELVTSLNGTTSQLRQLETSLTQLPSKLSDVNTRLSSSAENIGTAADQFGSATSGLRGLIEPLAQYASDTRQSIAETSETMRLASTQMGKASEEIDNAMKVLDEKISAQLQRLDGADEQLAGLLEGIQDSTTRVLSEINEFVTTVDSGFAKSIGALNESISEFEEVVNSIRTPLEENPPE